MENLKNRLTKRTGGFTLVELLVVIAIIAILSVTAYVAMGGQTGKARNSRRMQDLSSIQSALEIYFVEKYSKYPDNLGDLVPTYMAKLPADPIPKGDGSSRSYSYGVDGDNKTYQLATTLEEDPDNKAYVIGNGSTLIPADSCKSCGAGGKVIDGSTTCVPYCP